METIHPHVLYRVVRSQLYAVRASLSARLAPPTEEEQVLKILAKAKFCKARDISTDDDKRIADALDDVLSVLHTCDGEEEVWDSDELLLSEKAQIVADMREQAWVELRPGERPVEGCRGCEDY